MTMTDKKRGRGSRNYRANGPMLRHYRDRAHLTLEELEEAAGVSYTTISRIETGRIVSPRWSTLRPLAKALGVEVDSIVVHEAPAEYEAVVPDEPAPTAENEARLDEVRREKEARDEGERGGKDASDTGDRAP